jgi:hypothetical protein
VIACASRRAARKPDVHEVLLDEEDGLDWPTLCKCDLIYAVSKSDLKRLKGRVTGFRQSQIIRTIIAAHAWTEVF